MSFNLSDSVYTSLDAVGQRYGVRPSTIMRFHPLDGRGLLFDLKCMQRGYEAQQRSNTLGGELDRKKSLWDKDALREFRGNMI